MREIRGECHQIREKRQDMASDEQETNNVPVAGRATGAEKATVVCILIMFVLN